ncbi:MAG TPA: MotA/TolQ/ExbB proton channel family protein [Terriglobia bacterium]|nr:MotA/TolQ/ExbB proton channel family protein [Terriglobia bacterium]
MAAAILVFYQGFTQDFYQGEVWQLLANTGPVARLVLLMLLAFSILSWAIILRKFRTFRAAKRESVEFLKVFRQSKKLSEIRAFCRTLKESPLPEVFQSGYREIESQATMTENPGKPRIRSLEAVRRALQIGASSELGRLEQWLPWLATTGGVTPFVGLFGTVWGIIDAFHGLATAGTASLHSVAPGIAEALITTAAGLFTAIPAVIAYNLFLQRVKEFGTMMDDFGLEFLNMTERYFTD